MEIGQGYSSYRTPDDAKYQSLRQPMIDQKYSNRRPSRRLMIDNRDRYSGSPFDFQVRFANSYRANCVGTDEYRNVSAVEMKLLAFPKIVAEDYVIVSVEQFKNDSNLDASNNAADRAFAVGFFDTSQLSAGDTKPIRDFYSQKVMFNPPLPKLDRLDVRFLLGNGATASTGVTGGKSNVCMLLEISSMY